jgi:hypothetical protein
MARYEMDEDSRAVKSANYEAGFFGLTKRSDIALRRTWNDNVTW